MKQEVSIKRFFSRLKDGGYPKEKHFAIELPVKQAPFIMEHCFYSKLWLTNYGHSNLSIWQIFSWK